MRSPNSCPACDREAKTGEPVSRHDQPAKPKNSGAVTVHMDPPPPQIIFVPVEPRRRA